MNTIQEVYDKIITETFRKIPRMDKVVEAIKSNRCVLDGQVKRESRC